MNMVAAAKLQKAEARAEEAKPFFAQTRKTLTGLTANDEDLHPLLEERAVDKVGYIVITGDRGLCGPYNSKVEHKTEAAIENRQEDSALVTIGKHGRNYFKRTGVEIVSEYLDLADNPTFSTAANIGKEVIDLYRDEAVDEINLVYTEFESVLNHNVELLQLLPVKPPEEEVAGENFLYEPSAGAVLGTVLPQYINNLIFGALLQSKASEFASRMTAMDSATENAEEMIEELTLSYNRARQSAITQELTEIVGGAEALE